MTLFTILNVESALTIITKSNSLFANTTTVAKSSQVTQVAKRITKACILDPRPTNLDALLFSV